jgi:hypothetical protein
MVFGTIVIHNNGCVELLFSIAVIFKFYYFFNTSLICVSFPNFYEIMLEFLNTKKNALYCFYLFKKYYHKTIFFLYEKLCKK